MKINRGLSYSLARWAFMLICSRRRMIKNASRRALIAQNCQNACDSRSPPRLVLTKPQITINHLNSNVSSLDVCLKTKEQIRAACEPSWIGPISLSGVKGKEGSCALSDSSTKRILWQKLGPGLSAIWRAENQLASRRKGPQRYANTFHIQFAASY